MTDLSEVTLVCVDCVDLGRASRAIDKCLEGCVFGAIMLFSDKPGLGVVNIPAIRTVNDYSKFVLRELRKYVKTSHCLVVQHDGYILDAQAWDDVFLEYDYVGAPWPQDEYVNKVGNGGFSLRSRRLLELAAELPIDEDACDLEDKVICLDNYELLESKGIHFAPKEIASRFSVENGTWCGQFGFHNPRITNLSMYKGRLA